MNKLATITIITIASLAFACGGKSTGSSTPSNTGGSAMEQGAPTGGATYGSAGSAASAADPCAAPADPCAAPK